MSLVPPRDEPVGPVAARAVTVAIVEDDPVLRDCLAGVIQEADGFELVGAVGTLAEAMTLVSSHPDVVLVDLGLPDGSGLDAIAHARALGGRSKVIVLTVFADVRSVVRAIEEGADGYLLKDADVAQITGAIGTVLDGGAPISPAVASHILARVRGGGPARPAPEPSTVTLTPRETAVLELLASGSSFKEVAAKQGISLHTVGDHVKSIYRKLSVNSRGEAVFKAVQTGLISLGD